MKCNLCGKENSKGIVFCTSCGNRLDKQQPVQPQPVPMPQPVPQEPVQPVPQQVVTPVQPVQPVTPVQPVAPVAPVQPVQPMQQPIPPTPQYNQPVYQSNNDKQKYIILGLLGVIVIILAIIVFILLGRNKQSTPNNGPRIDENTTKTIMIYIVGSNLESDGAIVTSDLAAVDPKNIDLTKTNVLIYTGGTKRWHNYIKNDENAIYKLTTEGFEKIETYPKKNMGDASTLQSFLDYAYNNYKADYFDLMLYDHGGAIDGAIYDDFTNDNLSLEDFDKALKDSAFDENNKLDLVMFRTCLNGTLEVSSVFDNYANYIVFSEEVTLGSSMSNILGYLLNDIQPQHVGVALGEKFIDAYNKQMEDIDLFGDQPVTYSIVDLSKVQKVLDNFDQYITSIDLKSHYKDIATIRTRLYQYGKEVSAYDTVDLVEILKQLQPYSSASNEELMKSINEAVIKNNTNLDKSNGLSIYMPYKGAKNHVTKFLNVYNKLGINKNYITFINSFYNAKDSSSTFSFDISKNENTMSENEVELTLTSEQQDSIVDSSYMVFRQDPSRPQYYQAVYYSNNSTMDNGVVRTNFNNKLIKISSTSDDSQDQLIYVNDIVKDNNRKRNTNAIIIDKDVDITDDNRQVASKLLIDEKDGKLQFGNMELISRDERVEGIIYDTSKYEMVDIYQSMYSILDKNGKLLPVSDWTTPKVYYGFESNLSDVVLSYEGTDDGNFFVVFFLTDYNNHTYMSDLIKVGE